jgi:hypothetical protein
MVKYLNFHNSSFAKIIFDVNGKAIVWHTPCYSMESHLRFVLLHITSDYEMMKKFEN